MSVSDPKALPEPGPKRQPGTWDRPIQGVAILGTGAMACLFASRIRRLAAVTLVGTWRPQVERIARRGLEVTELDGSTNHHTLLAVDDPDAVVRVSPRPVSLILVQVKGPATERAARWARRILDASPTGGAGLVLTLQNGLGHLEHLVAAVGADRAALGVTEQGAHVTGLGAIRHAGEGITVLAREPATASRLEAAAELFERAGLPTRLTDDVAALVWSKLVVNSAINPLTALLDVTNGFLVEEPAARQLMQRAAEETAAVARALGVRLPFADAGERAAMVCRGTAANRSSMLQDRSRGARTEVDAICGAVVETGRRLGVATPVNEILWQRLGGPARPAGEPNEAVKAAVEELDHLLRRRHTSRCTN